MSFLKLNLALVLAFMLPLFFVLGVAAFTYIPSWFLTTQYDFVYTTCPYNPSYYQIECKEYLALKYSIVGSTLVIQNLDTTQDVDDNSRPDFAPAYNDRIFLYDTETDESREITPEEAETLQLSGLLTSPDGVSVSFDYEYNSSEFLLFYDSSSSYDRYLKKGSMRRKLHVITDDNSYRDNFHFVGWVTTK